MQHSNVIIGALACCIIGLIYGIWLVANKKGLERRAKVPPSDPNRIRQADQRKLTPHEQRIVDKARQLASDGQIKPAAQLFEQIGQFRDAVTVLERNGLIEDAAAVLLKIQRPNRAGYLLARHARWKAASECFKTAGLISNAARCLREHGAFQEASKLFIQDDKFEEAAHCYFQDRSWRNAARYYLKANNLDSARIAFEFFFSDGTQSSTTAPYSAEEIEFFKLQIEQGSILHGYVRVLTKAGLIVDLVQSMLSKGNLADAISVLKFGADDIGPLLMSRANFQGPEAIRLAEVFHATSQFRYAGMTYEQVGDFSAAGKAFESAEAWDRAAYCYDRIGDRALAESMRTKEKSAFVLSSTEVIGGRDSFQNSADKTRALEPQPKPVDTSLGGGSAGGVFSLEMRTNSSINLNEQNPHKVRLSQSQLFKGLEKQMLEEVWKLGRLEAIDAAETLLNFEDQIACFYFVLEGSLECMQEDSVHGERRYAVLSPGDLFGEFCGQTGGSTRCKLIAKVASELLVFEKGLFQGLLDRDMLFSSIVYKHFTDRLTTAHLNPLKTQSILKAS